MANRAYLYASDSEDGNNWRLPEDGEYFDSRWTIPFAWWFLFDPEDLKLVDFRFDAATWQSLRFVADRMTAINRIVERRQLLDPLVRKHLDLRHVDYFIAVLSQWRSRYLLMDPDQIFDADPHNDAARISTVLTDLQRGTISGADVLKRLSNYSAIQPVERADVLIVGCAYGPIASRIWRETMAQSES